ncbi:MAG: D-isomer specific 2-hydroxyacid dehydrogenase family protein [Actinomycetota bacterium]|nr:D-isomer specific 2-hydroxyacid dehydrogenase family protein [Actinomycetota bacterium]
MTRNVAVAPDTRPEMYKMMCDAVERSGATLTDIEDAEGLIWADPARPELFPEIAEKATSLEWIQLPYAGIEPFANNLDSKWRWTCGKGVYAPAVAETVLALALSLSKNLHGYARASEWSGPVGRYLHGSNVTILGGGGITVELLPLLAPFDCTTTVIRRKNEDLAGATFTHTPEKLEEVLETTDLLILALALTKETKGIIDKKTLGLMPSHCHIVNVARGGHIVTEDLIEALKEGKIAGAALDVTDPEPLPADSPLWSDPRCIITPHIGNTPEMGLKLLDPFIEENVRRFINDEELLAPVDVELGY